MAKLKMPDGSEMERCYSSEEDARNALEEYYEVVDATFCPLSSDNCRRNCMFFDDGCVYQETEGSVYGETWIVSPPYCSYGKG